ncbi:UNKNOWN [Stylonychia lemnae]|uniref:Uncharacterized protein n=1 Tax=Stylonychia lemnae TaxID=5949 RepID=A0A078AUX7_STYLE|nr:UNKNOWN [Stylonychia lemnae]|eukprot:CDW84673.1 UNKNOWN [Stylonychia lemnae]
MQKDQEIDKTSQSQSKMHHLLIEDNKRHQFTGVIGSMIEKMRGILKMDQHKYQQLEQDDSDLAHAETPRTDAYNTKNKAQVKDTPIFAGVTSLNDSQNRGGAGFNEMHINRSFHNSQSQSDQQFYKSNNSFNNSQFQGDETSKQLKQAFNASNPRYSDFIGHQIIENSADNRRHSQNHHQNLQNMNDYDLEEFLKSTNSAVSDYQFLFENIDQQLQNNTQMMAEELSKNMPDYLMNTNNSILLNKDSFKSGQDHDQSLCRSSKNNDNMPRMIKDTHQSSTHIRQSNNNHNQRDLHNNSSLIFNENGSAGVAGGNYLEHSANMSSQIDITNMSDEIISIEETYRETNAACRKSMEEIQPPQSQQKGNKSMTIIEEEDYEESEIINNGNQTNTNLFSQMSLKMNTMKKSTSSNLNRTRQNLQQNQQQQITQPTNESMNNQAYQQVQQRNPNNHSNLRDSYETFGGLNSEGGSGKQNLQKNSQIYNTSDNVQQRSNKMQDQLNEVQDRKVATQNNIGGNKKSRALSGNIQSEIYGGRTAAATLADAESKNVTLMSPMNHFTINHTHDSIGSTISYPQEGQRLQEKYQNLRMQQNIYGNQEIQNNEGDCEDDQSNKISIHDMLKRYQEKYKKQKEDSQKFNQNNQQQVFEFKDTRNISKNIKKPLTAEDTSDSENEYVNRSFVSTTQINQQHTRKRDRSNVSLSKPFDFVDDQVSNQNQELQEQDQPIDSRRMMNLERELNAYARHIQELEDLVKMTENQKLKTEKQLLQQQLQFENEFKAREHQFSKELKIKQNEIESLYNKLEEQQQLFDQKMENQRDRLKRVEKTVYERVEQEYSQILTEKDNLIMDQNNQILQLDSNVRQLKDHIAQDQVALEMRHEEQKLKERQFILQEREDIKYKTLQENDKEMRRLKERIESEYQFKFTQMEQKYKQKILKIESMYRQKQDAFLVDKQKEFQSLKEQEISRFQEEKLINHARTTQIVYEDVSKTLISKTKEEEKHRIDKIRNQMKEEYEDKMRKKENQLSMQLAQERKAKGQVELKNAQLEDQVYELMEKLRSIEQDKENINHRMNAGDTKELANKLKKVNKALPLK